MSVTAKAWPSEDLLSLLTVNLNALHLVGRLIDTQSNIKGFLLHPQWGTSDLEDGKPTEFISRYRRYITIRIPTRYIESYSKLHQNYTGHPINHRILPRTMNQFGNYIYVLRLQPQQLIKDQIAETVHASVVSATLHADHLQKFTLYNQEL